MNGIHDMGGMQGMGPIEYEAGEPPFHHEWEGRVHAMHMVMRRLGKWNIDMARFAQEQLPPATYLQSSYYQRWLLSLEALLVEKGVVTAGELATGRPSSPPPAQPATSALPEGPPRPARFRGGDAVITRQFNPLGHTRLPRYARGRHGTIDRILPQDRWRQQ